MSESRILTGCSVLPPQRPANGNSTTSTKAKNKTRGKTAGRFACINAFVDVGMVSLKPVEQAVWFVLWRDTKSNGLAYTAQADMARRIGVSDRTVRRAIDRLEQLEFLRVVRRGRLQTGPSIYRVIPLPAT